MTGVFNQRPPQQRYTGTWEVETVLNYLRSLPENHLLSDKLLTLKLAVLVALTSASRVSKLKNLSIDCYANLGATYIFFSHKLTKIWRKNKPAPPSLKCSSFFEKNSLCVSNTLHNYLIRRKTWGTNETQVLVSLINCHKAVSSVTVSRQPKQALEIAGIGTESFKGHSTRVASSTKADVSGVSFSIILKQGHWSKASTIHKFYRKNFLDPSFNFQVGILNKVLNKEGLQQWPLVSSENGGTQY